MEEMYIELDGVKVESLPIPKQNRSSGYSDEYIARRKAAGAKLPILDIPIPEDDDSQGHRKA